MHKLHYFLAATITLVACAAAAALFNADHYSFLYFGDAAAHIVRTRQFIDSAQPGLHNIGTVWLPLPHLLMLPFSALDVLFFSGIAGLIVGIPCIVAASLLLFELIRRVTGNQGVALTGALVFGLNPNILYMGLTPMSEAPFLLLLTLAALAFYRWQDSGSLRWLDILCLAVALGTLCRYEMWLAPAFLTMLAIGRRAMTASAEAGSRQKGEVLPVLLSWTGIVAWLVWNGMEYGDPVIFARFTYGAGSPVIRAELAYHPLSVLQIFGTAELYVFGPLLLLAFLAGVYGVVRDRSRTLALLLGFLLLPALFTIGALFAGFVQMDRWWWNSRYVLPLGLPLIVGAALGTARWLACGARRLRWSIIIAACAVLPAMQLFVPAVGVVTFKDAKKSFYDRTIHAIRVGEELRSMYRGGSIALLAGYSQGQRVMVSSGINLREFRIMYHHADKELYAPLWERDNYVVLVKHPSWEMSALVNYWLGRRNILEEFYNVQLENSDYLLLTRKERGSVAGDKVQVRAAVY